MNRMLRLLTEEGRTRARNAARRMRWYVLGVVGLSLLLAALLCRFWVYENFTTLQKEYLGQYLSSAAYSYVMPRSMSRYTTLVRTVIDPKTKQESVLAVLDDDIIPELDADNHLQTDQNKHIKLFLKPGVEHKVFEWRTTPVQHQQAYSWFRQHVYEDNGFIGLWAKAWISGLLLLFAGIAFAIGVDVWTQRRYLKGEPIRGTRKLSLRTYAQEHQHHLGYKFKVYDPK